MALEITADWTAPGGAWYRALRGVETVLSDEPWGRRWGHTTTFVEGTIAPLRGAEGEVLGGVMTLRDVSERVQGAEMLRASEARFRNLFERAAVGIVVLDVDGVLCDVNPAFERLLGYTAAELVGRRVGDLSPPEDAARTRGPVREVYAGRRRSATVETRMLHLDGAVRWVNFSVSRFEGHGAGRPSSAWRTTSPSARRSRPSSPTRRITTRSPGSPTACCSPTASRARSTPPATTAAASR
jgi:PAS domain S-box-containing protein